MAEKMLVVDAAGNVTEFECENVPALMARYEELIRLGFLIKSPRGFVWTGKSIMFMLAELPYERDRVKPQPEPEARKKK